MVTVYYGICYRDVCHEFHWFLDCVGISWTKAFLDKSSPARSQIVVIYFTLLKVSQIIVNADANASKVLFNIVNFWNCTKSWMHSRAYKILQKKKKEDKNCVGKFWMKFVLGQTFHPTFSGTSNQIFILDAFEYSFI